MAGILETGDRRDNVLGALMDAKKGNSKVAIEKDTSPVWGSCQTAHMPRQGRGVITEWGSHEVDQDEGGKVRDDPI